MSGDCLYTVLPFIASILSLSSTSLTDQVLSYGIWTYMLIFIVILFTSTIVGGAIPDSTFLILIGAAAIDNELSMLWLVVVAALGGFAGYEINYWSGKFFGLAICRGSCPVVLHDRNVKYALSLMDRFGATAFIVSRFLPVMNVPSFIAGVNVMDHRRYLVFNLASAVVWCGTDLLVGYNIGGIPVVSANIGYLTGVFVIILAAAIVVAVGMFVRDYVRRKRKHTGG